MLTWCVTCNTRHLQTPICIFGQQMIHINLFPFANPLNLCHRVMARTSCLYSMDFLANRYATELFLLFALANQPRTPFLIFYPANILPYLDRWNQMTFEICQKLIGKHLKQKKYGEYKYIEHFNRNSYPCFTFPKCTK